MGGLGSPCGGCKFLRRKCNEGCVFAPYFCYEEGSSNFAAIHKVFGASNFSKLISNLPDHDRCDAVRTISYEAQSRLHDPIYGCVSQIFSLQQQVVTLQAQVILLREEASKRFPPENPGCNLKQEKLLAPQQDLQNWFHQGILEADLEPMSGAATHDHGSSMDRNESFSSSNESLYYHQEAMFPWSVRE